ncbi:MAG: prepilin peptidase [Bdellovibrio sp.]|nr:prepilin peptidase [Bdellovibrio sp.]
MVFDSRIIGRGMQRYMFQAGLWKQMIPLSVYLFLLIELVAVAYIDILSKKIPNVWSILNLAFFVLFIFLMPEEYQLRLTTFFYSLSFLFVGFVLYLLKIMGPGDSKFLFSFYLLVPASIHEKVFLCLIYATILIGSFFFIRTIIRNLDKMKQALILKNATLLRKAFGKKFAYAPVMLVSWIWFGIQNKELLALK